MIILIALKNFTATKTYVSNIHGSLVRNLVPCQVEGDQFSVGPFDCPQRLPNRFGPQICDSTVSQGQVLYPAMKRGHRINKFRVCYQALCGARTLSLFHWYHSMQNESNIYPEEQTLILSTYGLSSVISSCQFSSFTTFPSRINVL